MTRKQAVLLIHGIGEQRPMDTLRGFVDTVWTRDASAHHPDVPAGCWSKPDQISDSFELRRLTTSQDASGRRTDFYEFYWAHLMMGTTFGHLVGWARRLVWRSPSSVPRHLLPIYLLVLVALCVSLALAIYGAYASQSTDPGAPPWLAWIVSVAILPAIGALLKGVLGDAARYLHVAPGNIQRRHEIRQAGVEVLTKLHAKNYERIIIVGHSLGSVIGYDLLYYYWSKVHATHSPDARHVNALEEIERRSVSPRSGDTLESFQSAQRAFAQELRTNGCPWAVTDFVTLGSPLAHAAILLASDAGELCSRQKLREFQTCPPAAETFRRGGAEVRQISYQPEDGRLKVPHHAAAFASTRWTNLYFPRFLVLGGDVVGGKLAPWFGSGIRDVAVKTSIRWGLLSHTLYWSTPKRGMSPHIESLRAAVNLLDK